jgi:hypothetical protein
MAPHGFLGAAAAGAAAGFAALVGAAFCAGAAGVCGAASRLVTWFDCWPIDLPPPMRRAASAFRLPKAITPASISVINLLFMVSPTQEIQFSGLNI